MCDGLDHHLRRPRRADADGVAKGNFLATHFVERAGNIRDRISGDRALIGAAENARDIAAHANTGPMGRRHHRFKTTQGVSD